MVQKTETREEYSVASGEVFLSIVFGDGQLGTSVVVYNNKILRMGDIQNLKIGSGPDLAGNSVKIKSTVTDVNDKTDRTSVTYTLRGGTQDREFAANGMVEEPGGSMVYRAEFQFTS